MRFRYGAYIIITHEFGWGFLVLQIYVWSVKTGRLLDILSGHKGPVPSLAFSPTRVRGDDVILLMLIMIVGQVGHTIEEVNGIVVEFGSLKNSNVILNDIILSEV